MSEDPSLSVAAGAFLSAAAGALTGAAWVRMRASGPGAMRSSSVVTGVVGAVLATLAYGAFLLVCMVFAVMMFSEAPDPLPALLCVLIGCAAFLLLTWLQSIFRTHFGLPPKTAGQPRRVEDLIDARPKGGAGTMWLAGVGLALLPLVYGVECLLTRQGSLGTTLWRNEIHGIGAVGLGIGWIAVGAFLHFHFFFGLHPSLQTHSRGGKWVAVVAACLGFTTAGLWSMASQSM